MVKSDGKVTYSDELPEFFKIYVPAMYAESMRIPPEFIKKFGGDIPTIVTLRRPSGISWQVDMKRFNDHWFFQKGWPEFVQENSIEDGDFLTFCYAGNSIFCVKVYARNGCRKRVDNSSRIHGKLTENLQGNEASEPENPKHNGATRRNLIPKSTIARKSVCRNPSFSVVMTKSYIHKGCLHIPMKFWKVYTKKDESGSRMVTLRIRNNSWLVRLVSLGVRVQFSKGWPKFVKDNSLQNGNLCTFQLIDSNDLAFKVTVNR
ncbi:hypothetical protein Pfo_001864 [Paulownia fortunei]|nr:hypothetical protein Pfo_001864 [Paulownia fortunei]